MSSSLFASFPAVPTSEWISLLDSPSRFPWHVARGVDVAAFYGWDEVDPAGVEEPALLNRDHRFGQHLSVRQSFSPSFEDLDTLVPAAVLSGARQIELHGDLGWRDAWNSIQKTVGWHLSSTQQALSTHWVDRLPGRRGTVRLSFFEKGVVDHDVDVGHLLKLTHSPLWPSAFRFLDVDLGAPEWQAPDAVGRLAIALGGLAEYLAILTDQNEPTAKVATKLHVLVPIGAHYLAEIAFLRALRIGHDRILRAFGVQSPPPLLITGTVARARQRVGREDLIRCASLTASALVGGADSVSYRFERFLDETPEETSRLLRNVQLVLQFEARATEVQDPAAGSYYMEKMTDLLVSEAWRRFAWMEKNGGLAKLVSSGDWVSPVHEELDDAPDDHAS